MHLIFECIESFWTSIENLKWVALAFPEIIVIAVLVGVVNPNLGEEEIVGVPDGTIRKSVGDFL